MPDIFASVMGVAYCSFLIKGGKSKHKRRVYY
jgi:hypothetical protein